MFDTNFKKIVAIIVVICILGLGYYYFSGKGPDLDISEYPNGVKWGTDRDTVESFFDSEAGYTKIEFDDGFNAYYLMYFVDDYLGIEGLNGIAVLSFDENQGFEGILYRFSVQGFPKYPTQSVSIENLEYLKNGVIKAHNRIYDGLEFYNGENSNSDIDCYWDSDESWAHLEYWEGAGVNISYSAQLILDK